MPRRGGRCSIVERGMFQVQKSFLWVGGVAVGGIICVWRLFVTLFFWYFYLISCFL